MNIDILIASVVLVWFVLTLYYEFWGSKIGRLSRPYYFNKNRNIFYIIKISLLILVSALIFVFWSKTFFWTPLVISLFIGQCFFEKEIKSIMAEYNLNKEEAKELWKREKLS